VRYVRINGPDETIDLGLFDFREPVKNGQWTHDERLAMKRQGLQAISFNQAVRILNESSRAQCVEKGQESE